MKDGPTQESDAARRLISRTQKDYGDRFSDHLLEQYKLYVESAQKVSEKRISISNYLLTVNSSLLTFFGLAATVNEVGAWVAVIPLSGLLVSMTWFSLVISFKNLNTAKFRVIHELEEHLPAALFRYEWHSCEQGEGSAYRPVTHLEKFIPLIFVSVYLILGIYSFAHQYHPTEKAKAVSVSGSVDVNLKTPVVTEQKGAPVTVPQVQLSPKP